MPFTANAYKGKLQTYFEQARDTAADLGALLLLASGLPGDDALADYLTVADLLAGTADEASFTNYVRKTLAAPTVTIDNAANRTILSITGSPPTVQWQNAGGPASQQAIGKIVYYYIPAGGGADNALLVLSGTEVVTTTDGTHITVTIGTLGIATVEHGV